MPNYIVVDVACSRGEFDILSKGTFCSRKNLSNFTDELIEELKVREERHYWNERKEGSKEWEEVKDRYLEFIGHKFIDSKEGFASFDTGEEGYVFILGPKNVWKNRVMLDSIGVETLSDDEYAELESYVDKMFENADR